VAFLVGESDNLVFDGWTIPGANSLDDPAIKRGAIKTTLDDVVGCLIGVCHVTGDLVCFDLLLG
jgi:hypothetical protein